MLTVQISGASVKLTDSERRMILERLYERLGALESRLKEEGIERKSSRRIRSERKAIVLLIGKLESAPDKNIDKNS